LTLIFQNGCVEPGNKKNDSSGKNRNFNLFKVKNKARGKVTNSFTWDYEYNNNGLPLKITDPGDKTTEFKYEFYSGPKESLKNVEKKTGDGIVNYLFGESGNLTGMFDKSGQVNYNYDNINRLIKVTRVGMPSISYTYNTCDQITSMSLSDGYRIDYVYDFLGRLSVMKTPAGEFVYNYFTGDGVVERKFPNGIRSQYKFSPGGNLESITYADKTNSVLVKYTYSYNPDGLINAIDEWTRQGERKLSYEYDAVQRLTSFVGAGGKMTTYIYDEFGNRTETTENGSKTESYTYDGLGRMLLHNDIKFEYDNSGNLLTDEKGVKSFEYSSSNQLQKAGSTRYEYDGDGSLIAREKDNQKTTFLNNPFTDIWQPILAQGDNGRKTFYIWEGNNPIARIENGETTFFLTDHLGSVRNVLNVDGNITQELNYCPFGIPDQTSIYNFGPGFTGLFYEPETRLYLTRARAYNPNSGRFLQIDPLHQIPSGTQKELSLFAFCGMDPINYHDRIGLQASSFNPLEMLDRMDKWIHSVLDDFSYGNYFNNLPAYGNNPSSNELFKSGLKDLFDYVNPLKQLYDGTKYDFLGSPFKIPSDYLGKSHAVYSSYKDLSSIDQVSISGKLDAIGNLTKFNPLNTTSAILTPVLKAYWGTVFNYLNYNPSDNLMNKYGETKVTFDPTTNSIRRTSHISYTETNIGGRREIKINNYKQISSENQHGSKIDIKKPEPLYQAKLKRPDDDYPGLLPGRFDRDAIRIDNDWPPGGGGDGVSNVGGISLSGAGKAFEGLGNLSGIAIDKASGKLTLLSEEKGKINLPSLRLDDVVTIFLSVYLNGEAPFVSIDPDSLNPKGPVMHSRHGKATENTYVGWILFEADRVMKAYSLGEDNISKKSVKSGIDGYDKVLDALFTPEAGSMNWERFWIVPSLVERNTSTDNSLTLYDVPLMVKTQKMVMKNGKLIPAQGGKSSKGAEEFSKWFTDNYDKIAAESLSETPEGSGMTGAVPIFLELRRIALITAIAEQLRDQGVAIPFWMRNYEVKPFPTPKTTPSHTVSKNKGKDIFVVFGGVNLTPSMDKIITKSSSPVANTIAPKISAAVKKQIYITPVAITIDNKKFQAAVIPGNETKDLGPCVLSENDLSVPVNGDYEISMARNYNSFLTPLDNMFGKTWTLDLPFLEEQRIPVQSTGESVEYKIAFNLITPLNSYSKKIEKIYTGDNKLIKIKTRVVALAYGKDLYFNEKGFLVAYEEKPFMILYNRDSGNRIFQIVGFYGQNPLADIKLEYDKEKLISASGSNGESVKYNYAPDGELKEVFFMKGGTMDKITGTAESRGYEYQNGLVTGIKFKGQLIRQFKYNEKGQLLSEKSNGGPEQEYSYSSNESGSLLTSYSTPELVKTKSTFLSYFKVKKKADKENQHKNVTGTIQYDNNFRPIKQVTEDGTVIDWDYSGNDYDRMEVSQPAGEKYTVSQSKDGSHVSYNLPDGINFDENYDKSGQLLAVSQNSQNLFTQEWNSEGKPELLRFENSIVNREYDKKEVLQRTLITPSGKSKTDHGWMEYKYNESGQVTNVSDFLGMETSYQYDQNGEVSSINSKQGSIVIKRNKKRVDEIETSWGSKMNYSYDPDGNILAVNILNSGNSSFLKFTGGQIREISGSRGSKYSISYNPEPNNYQIKEIKSPINNLEYSYNKDGNLVNVLCNSKYEVAYLYDQAGRIKQVRINSR